LKQLKSKGGFSVYKEILEAAKRDFESERVSDDQTIETIKEFYEAGTSHKGGYILDPHSAIGVAAALRSIKRTSTAETYHIALATAHPAKFANAVDLALKDEKDFSFDTVLPGEFVGLEKKERRVRVVPKGAGWEGVREIIEEEVKEELKSARRSVICSKASELFPWTIDCLMAGRAITGLTVNKVHCFRFQSMHILQPPISICIWFLFRR